VPQATSIERETSEQEGVRLSRHLRDLVDPSFGLEAATRRASTSVARASVGERSARPGSLARFISSLPNPPLADSEDRSDFTVYSGASRNGRSARRIFPAGFRVRYGIARRGALVMSPGEDGRGRTQLPGIES
jgi:hypothetical protein